MTPCPACGRENRDGSRFCRGCGTELAAPFQARVNETRGEQEAVDASRAPQAVTAARMTRRLPWGWVLGGALIVVLGFFGWRYRTTLGEMTAAVTGRAEAEQRLAELEAVTASKDSLFDELMETTSLITEVSHAVSALQAGRPDLVVDPDGEGGHPISMREARRILLARIDSVRIRLAAAESRAAGSLERMRDYAGTQERMQAQLADYEKRITAMTALVERQEAQLALIGEELTTLRSENVQLRAARDELQAVQGELQEQVTALEEQTNTVYWIAGSRGELERAGVIVSEGSRSVLGLVGRKPVQPVRDPPIEAFQALNRRQETVLQLPNPEKRYRLLTRQSPVFLQPVDRDGKVRGTVTITDADAFWLPSPYLILLED